MIQSIVDPAARDGGEVSPRALAWLAAAYPLLFIASIGLKPAIPIPSALFPPAALEFSAFWLLPRSRWPWVALVATGCDLLVIPAVTFLATAQTPPLGHTLLLSLITTLVSLGMALAAGAFGLGDQTGRVNALRIPALLMVLMLGALPGSLLSAWIHMDTTHQTILTLDVLIRCLSAVLTVIALCPLVLGLLRGFDEPIEAPAKAAERASIAVAFGVLCLVYFAVPWPLDRFLELMLLAGPLLWLSLRCSHRAVASGCAAVAIGIGVACAHGIGRFPALVAVGTWRDGILSAQVFLLLTCTEVLLINRIVLKQRALLEDSQRKQTLLAAYGRALDDAEDSARRAAARDLHDGVAQIIAGQSMILGALRRRMRESELHELLDQAIDASREAQSAVRATIEDLSPPEVDRASAQEILSWLREYFFQRYRFTVEWRIRGEACVDHGHSRLIYKAIRELIYNAYKHAETDSVRVELSSDSAGSLISVFDDGVGFDPNVPARDGRQRHGLSHLAERLAVVRGELDIRSSAGHGCTVTLFLPAPKPGSRPLQPAARDPARETTGLT